MKSIIQFLKYKEIKNNLFDLLEQKIEKYKIPIKKNRHYPRKKYKKNKYSINKRKLFQIIYDLSYSLLSFV